MLCIELLFPEGKARQGKFVHRAHFMSGTTQGALHFRKSILKQIKFKKKKCRVRKDGCEVEQAE